MIKKVFDIIISILIILFVTPWILWMIKFAFENSIQLEDVLPNLIKFVVFTILVISIVGASVVLGLACIVNYISNLRSSPTLEEIDVIGGASPPIPGDNNGQPIHERIKTNLEIANCVTKWFNENNITRIKRGTFLNGFSDIFEYLRTTLNYTPAGSNGLIKMDTLIDYLVSSKAFYLDGEYLTLSAIEPTESVGVFVQEFMEV